MFLKFVVLWGLVFVGCLIIVNIKIKVIKIKVFVLKKGNF